MRAAAQPIVAVSSTGWYGMSGRATAVPSAGCPGVGDLGLAHRGEREREGGQRGQQPDREHEPRPAQGASRLRGPAGRDTGRGGEITDRP